ncbi:hypothetical protein EJB05_19538, partial [Eragrostis curvula]
MEQGSRLWRQWRALESAVLHNAWSACWGRRGRPPPQNRLARKGAAMAMRNCRRRRLGGPHPNRNLGRNSLIQRLLTFPSGLLWSSPPVPSPIAAEALLPSSPLLQGGMGGDDRTSTRCRLTIFYLTASSQLGCRGRESEAAAALEEVRSEARSVIGRGPAEGQHA